ncbi:hypothetical protein B296_00030131 [Ensete ventricosum]|uniref:Uncharacterized protein n=1 Tax=Ensete ventricosum TaxID=4639 RepID=A0A427AFP2_ENSVE|nr:hypothetical protein B296_00030131 [Ensete ventricosum]
MPRVRLGKKHCFGRGEHAQKGTTTHTRVNVAVIKRLDGRYGLKSVNESDMTNADLVAKSSHPRTAGPPTAHGPEPASACSANSEAKRVY